MLKTRTIVIGCTAAANRCYVLLLKHPDGNLSGTWYKPPYIGLVRVMQFV